MRSRRTKPVGNAISPPKSMSLVEATTTATSHFQYHRVTRQSVRLFHSQQSQSTTSNPNVLPMASERESKQDATTIPTTTIDSNIKESKESTPPTSKRKITTTTTTTTTTPKKEKVRKKTTAATTTTTTTTTTITASPKKKAKTSSSGKSYSSALPPDNWERVYSLVEELRADRSAPVDQNGSEALPQHHHGEKVFRFQLLIALMLSSQTKDAVVGEAMRKLQTYRPPSLLPLKDNDNDTDDNSDSYCYLTVNEIAQSTPEDLNPLIRRVGFHNTKTTNILKVAQILQQKYDSDIPQTAQELMELPGVGPKMAFIIENIAFGRQTGIGIDTHMHRLFNQLKWVHPPTKQPEQTRKALESWLPKEKWKEVNLLFVGFGQEVQQYPSKVLRKAMDCSRPVEAIRLLQKVGVDSRKVGAAMGWTEEIQAILASSKKDH